MDGAFPQSPDLSSYAPRSPEHREISDLSGTLGSPRFTSNSNFAPFNQQQRFQPSYQANGFGGGAYQPTSIPQEYPPYQQHQPSAGMPPRQVKSEDDDDDFMPDAPAKRSRRVKQEPSDLGNGMMPDAAAVPPILDSEDPTLGCQLNTSFPVARIKRIMQADEDIGKVAQVTPTVVSRALELFMIRLISSSAHQARGPSGASKGPKRVLQQHLKKAVQGDEKFDFLNEIVDKVPDAPVKSKKENGSDSEDAKPKRKGKKRKDSGDDF